MQANGDPRFGPLGLNMLEMGFSAPKVLRELEDNDEFIEWRQIAVVDRDGRIAVRTGNENEDWRGHETRSGFASLGNRLTSELLDDLQEWNDSWDSAAVDAGVLQERGRDLAIRVQDELGTDGWEVLYKMGGQVRRVHPPGSWPAESWQQQLLGYGPRRRQPE